MKSLFEWVDNQILSVEVMADKIKKGEHFAFARYGDGEFDAMLKPLYPNLDAEDSNCDAHEYFPEMGKALRRCMLVWNGLMMPENYYIGMHFSNRIGEETYHWLKENNFDEDRKFANNSVFHDALVNGSVELIYEYLEDKDVIIVGPRRLKQQTKLILHDFVEVPETNSWYDREKLKDTLMGMDLNGKVILFCSGPPTGVFIHDIWGLSLDVTLIDFGSTLDPNIGVHSRNFHRKLNL